LVVVRHRQHKTGRASHHTQFHCGGGRMHMNETDLHANLVTIIYMLSRCECAWAQGVVRWCWWWSDCEQAGPITPHPWLPWTGREKSAYRSESPRSTHDAGASAPRTRVTVAGSVAVSRITSAEVRYCPYCGLSGSCVCACARAWQEMKSACTEHL
jgi:hypothetical protein